VTCLVDLFRPSVGFAAVKLLQDAGCAVEVPRAQTCCGQPAYNSGDRADSRAIAAQVIRAFDGFDYVVAPSGSCAGMIREHYPGLFDDDPALAAKARDLARRTYELISFLTGVVLAYQGADQLARFGAQIFTINLVGIGVLREMGILLTAIIVAGRSGSAYTAQIGTMKVNEEVDAMRTLGLDPMELLVLPRVIALIIVMPLLTFYADMMGLLGGAVMANVVLDISFFQFVRQLNTAVPLWSFWVGVIKAPLFGFIIALVGCYEGLQVTRSAESVGRQTTRAVVEAVFLVIVLDAVLSILFSVLGI